MSDIVVDLEVNGVRYERTVPARLSLADFLRDSLGLTGTHLGCEHGVCGSCTVLVDGRSARSCLLLAAQVSGATVRTVEGLAESDGSPGTVQSALARHGGIQCGFCTPGFVVALTELVAEGKELDEEEIREALSGNICRCTGYHGAIAAAVELTGPDPGCAGCDQECGS
ncbi:carbon-monoxide dehydrogenase small subunit [Tamaricihabitans halophyticus]|uniref:Carbon-monoxide dehydrogenase small subunit n=1 Tax=Tamaricihabitans halophyticus TaxID=1262583 RepID=A0A4R2R034_9PSEU|nr:(2Fe-2S)-binding protein [Tamaricihabitans halophyticus]TCP55327.1 carbon-monoxide dehydrogenase small subunit [Tamaricihabitans halophyticus]